jgi:hypothetical protein
VSPWSLQQPGLQETPPFNPNVVRLSLTASQTYPVFDNVTVVTPAVNLASASTTDAPPKFIGSEFEFWRMYPKALKAS